MSGSAQAARSSVGTNERGLFVGGGVSGDLINSIDWSATPLGPMPSWPSSLRTIVGTMLQSRHPMFLWWGPQLIQFYNDAYLPSFGVGKHPLAMSQRGEDCWGEIWPIIWPQIDDVMSRGKASWNEDHLVPIFRNGRIEEVYWTYGYSPVLAPCGRIDGTLVVCTETTSRVVQARRLRIVRRLADATSTCEEIEETLDAARDVFATARLDIPFALLYRSSREGGPTLLSSVNVDAEALSSIDAAVRGCSTGGPEGRRQRLCALPASAVVSPGPWPEAPSEMFVIRPDAPSVATFVFGISSRLPVDEAYRQFLADLADQVNRSVARVETFRARAAVEAERRNLLLQAPVAAALLIGADHVFELANPLFCQMVRREVVGKTYAAAFPEVVGTPLAGILGRVYETGEPFVTAEYLVQLDRGDGVLEDRFFKFNLEPVRDGSGAVYGMMAVAVDMTGQVTARRALERTNAEREKLVVELEAASRAKDAFLATVSHELRTPLNAILGWARMLRTGHMTADKVEGALEVIERNSLVQVQLIEDLLDVSRIDSGKLRLDVQSLMLAPVVEAAVESMRHALEAKDIRLSHVIDPSAGSISGDGHRIQQVIWNLLSNAVKFTPKGGTVRIIVERVDSSIELTVSDSGQGIAKELFPSIFERFKQADGSAARVHGGLGLGLAITRHIVELHGGTIEVHSEGAGRGATFIVRLPVASWRDKRDGPFRDQTAAGMRPQVEQPKELQGLTVLVVDDEEDTRELLSEVLHQLGSSVLVAATASEAIAILDRASPRVLVCDVGMPGMDGYQFIEEVRKRPREKGGRTVALALTAYASPADRRRALRAGYQMHLAKPVEPAEFVAVLANLAQLAIAMT